MKNKLSELNDHLFMMLERLNDNAVKGDELTEELKRAKGVVAIANSIVANANVQVEAYKAVNGVGDDYCDMPNNLLGNKPNEIH